MHASAVTLPFSGSSLRAEPQSPFNGLLFRGSIEFSPAPPDQDVLGNPVVPPRLPAYEWPCDTLSNRVCSLLGQLGWTSRADESSRFWQAQSAIALVMSA
ncbi:MAG: hypothetical protein WCF85_16705, partial [Rhodospirillaceae bacterium]